MPRNHLYMWENDGRIKTVRDVVQTAKAVLTFSRILLAAEKYKSMRLKDIKGK